MTASFNIDPSRFDQTLPAYRLPEKLNPGRSSCTINAEHIRVIEQDISGFEAKDRPVLTRLNVIKKVILVANTILYLAMPLCSYFPLWVPFGVGIPTCLTLMVLDVAVKRKIEVKNHEYDALLIAKKMFQKDSIESVKPLGEGDLKPVDHRLKSDLVMQEELNQKHPESAQHVEKVVSALDLEVSPFLKIQAARKLAQLPDTSDQWAAVKEKVIEAKGLLREGKIAEYEEAMKYARALGLQTAGPTPTLDTQPPIPAKLQVRALVGHYQYFCQLHGKLSTLYEEGSHFFGEELYPNWEAYLESVKKVKSEIDLFLPLLENRGTSEEEWLLASSHMREIKLSANVAYLIEASQKAFREIESVMAKHPVARIEALKEQFKKYDAWILSADALVALQGWINRNPEAAKRPLTVIVHRLPYSEEVKEWMKQHKEWAADPLTSVYKSNLKMRHAYSEAYTKAREQLPHILTIEEELFKSSDRRILSADALAALSVWIMDNPKPGGMEKPLSEVVDELPCADEMRAWMEQHEALSHYPLIEIYRSNFTLRTTYLEAWKQAGVLSPQFLIELKHLPEVLEQQGSAFWQAKLEELFASAPAPEAVQAFEREVMSPLTTFVGQMGEPSHLKRIWGAVSQKLSALKLPAKPFKSAPVLNSSNLARNRKVEELVVNDLLKAIDRNMLLSNRVRRYGLNWAAVTVLLIAQAVFLSNLWVAWGIGAAELALTGLSEYADIRLRKQNKQKQGYKLQMLLRDHPSVSRLPGSRPSLQKLKEVQDHYGLDGVTRTWACTLAEGDEVLKSGHFRTIAQEGRQQVLPYLQRRYLAYVYAGRSGYGNYTSEIKLSKMALSPRERKKKNEELANELGELYNKIDAKIGDPYFEKGVFIHRRHKWVETRGYQVGREWRIAVQQRRRCEQELEHLFEQKMRLEELTSRRARSEVQAGQIQARLPQEAELQEWKNAYIYYSALIEKASKALAGEHPRTASPDQLNQLLAGQIPLESALETLLLFPHESLYALIQELQLRCMQIEQAYQTVERMQIRLQYHKQQIPAYEPSQIEQLKAQQEQVEEQLKEAQYEERLKGVELAIEKQLLALDPEIEKKRRVKQTESFEKLTRQLVEAKREIAQALLNGAIDHNPMVIDDAFETYKSKLHEISESILKKAPKKERPPITNLLKSEFQLVNLSGIELIPELKHLVIEARRPSSE